MTATTLAFGGARPVVSVGSFTSAVPPAPSQPDSRGVTHGTWRGNNILYTYAIPSGTLVAGSNTITISVASGSSGDTFLYVAAFIQPWDLTLTFRTVYTHLRSALVVLGGIRGKQLGD
ncbi:polysaccharide lyase family 4, domain III-domain-containing protein [Mycena vulgaris]|nr:polysaccharide lyase family 4, domain III-domain-containing protein [Mycena vulgaris]